jgi:hypothetical protein
MWDGGDIMVNEVDKLLSLMDGGEITDIYDDGLKHLNEDESIKETMISAIAEDISQYLDSSWGEEKPEVKFIGNEVFIVYEGRKMKPVMFYSCASNNYGKVPKMMFNMYSKPYEDL